MKAKKVYKRGFKKWSDDKVIELRKELALKSHSPLCAFALAKHLHIPILEPSSIAGMSEKDLNILLKKDSKSWSAATIPLGNSKNIIVHNPTHSSGRQQSNLMHELAHILCGHKVDIEKIPPGLGNYLRNHNEQDEDEAVWLGACLQLPRPALLWCLKKKMPNEEISKVYNASEEMVKYRIGITGVKRQLSYLQKVFK